MAIVHIAAKDSCDHFQSWFTWPAVRLDRYDGELRGLKGVVLHEGF